MSLLLLIMFFEIVSICCCHADPNGVPHLLHALVIEHTDYSWLFKSFESGNGSRMSNENLVMLEFKYLQNKKW